MSNLTIEDSLGAIYAFPESFWIKDVSWKIRSIARARAYASGGRDTGDGFLDSRVITIEGALRADSLAALETAERLLKVAIIKAGKLRVSDDTVRRYITVKGAMIAESYLGDYRFEKPMTITYLAEFPFWEDDTESPSTVTIGATPTDFTVDNSGSDFLVYPVITITANQAVPVPSVTLKNLSDGGMALIYNDPFFVVGDVVIIDSRAGTVRRNNNNTINYLTTPRFLRLQAGVNNIRYEGANCTIKFAWRKVYL